jgi:nicotinamidase-related amidase
MLLDASKSSLLIVDVQERLLPAMQEPERILSRTKILVQAIDALQIPISISEQYPKGLGKTVPELATGTADIFEKLAFSCWRDDALKAHFIKLHESGRPQVIVAGIEAHVCVLQTCIDLAMAGFAVFAVADAMSSREVQSANLAYDRLRGTGVQVVNTEMAVFELLEKAGTPEFKTLSGLIK